MIPWALNVVVHREGIVPSLLLIAHLIRIPTNILVIFDLVAHVRFLSLERCDGLRFGGLLALGRRRASLSSIG
jgi:hypothetical protein